MSFKASKLCRKYFAAANGHSGFRSYFDEVFPSEKFRRIFVFKGGPGTGKSSMMKKCAEHFLKLGASVDLIFCSSDPSSLDGVIITQGDVKIALIDGTAPHERDAVIPGAIDEIVNLGQCWQSDKLEKSRESILLLNKQKKVAYKNAYSALSFAGKAAESAKNITKVYYNSEFAEKTVQKLANKFVEKNKNTYTQLYCAFGKDGFVTFDIPSESIVKIGGRYGSGALFINRLYSLLSESKADMIHSPSVFSNDDTYAIISPDFSYALKLSENECEIDCSEFVNLNDFPEESYNRYRKTEDEFLSLSQKYFADASSAHFKLEDIYKDAMRFEINDEIRNNIISEIESMLGIG